MAGPGGIEAGRASLKVLPDLSQFTRSLERFIQRIERQVVVELPTRLDMQGVQESVKATQERVKASPAKMPVEPDTDGFGRQALVDVKKAVAKIEADIPLTADGERLRRDVALKVAALKRQIHELSVSVPLDAGEAAKARAEIRAKVAEIQAMVRADPVEIPVEVDRKQVRDVAFALQAIKMPQGAGFAKATGIAGLGILAAASVPNILALAGSITQVAGAAALLPGVGAAAAFSIGALVLGFRGVGDALKSAKTPAQTKAVAEALKNLAPNARAAVVAIKDLGPSFKDLRLDVQNALFADVAKTVQTLAATWLPTLKRNLTLVASAANKAFGWVATAAASPRVVRDIGVTMRSTAGFVEQMGRAFSFLLPAFATLGQVGASFLPGLAKGFGDLSSRFNTFVQGAAKSGALSEFIQTGLTALGDLVDVGKGAIGIVTGLVKAAQAAGGGTLATFATLLGDIADAINSPAFQKGLTAFFQGVQDGASGLLGSAMPALAELFAQLGPVLADFARQAGPAIGQIIAALAPVATELVKALGPAFVAVLKKFADIVVEIAPTLERWATSLQDVDPLLLGLVAVAVALLPTIISLAGAFAGAVESIAVFAGLFAEGGILAAVGAVAGPVLAVVAAVAALAAGFYFVYQNSQPVRDAVAQLGDAFSSMWAVVSPILDQLYGVIQQYMPQIQATVQQVWSTIQTVIVTVLQIIRAQITVVTAVISAVWSVFGDTILGVVKATFGTIMSIIRGAMDIIQGIFRTVGALLKGDWSGVWDGIKQTVSGAWDIIKALVTGGINNAIAVIEGLGGNMLKAGQKLIQSLIDGITSRVRAVKDKVGEVADTIAGFFHGSPVQEGPLKAHGWNENRPGKLLAQSLADGMSASQSVVARASSQLAGSIAVDSPGGAAGAAQSMADLAALVDALGEAVARGAYEGTSGGMYTQARAVAAGKGGR